MKIRQLFDRRQLALPSLALMAITLLSLSIHFHTDKPASLHTHQIQINGINLVATRDSLRPDHLDSIRLANVNWISMIPYAFIRQSESQVVFGNDWQWFGETPAGIRQAVQLAKADGFKVMLKPQLWVMPYAWSGDFIASDWPVWETSYRDYILTYARIAEEFDLEMICIGTELAQTVRQRPDFWRQLIRDVRAEYGGLITYSSNWDEFAMVPFWDELDFIGINAYFPLVNHPSPDLDSLRAAWQQPFSSIRKLASESGKSIIFTEYGYRSLDFAAWRAWEMENRDSYQQPANDEIQVKAYQALFDQFWDQSWFRGGFLWKWYPSIRRPERMQTDWSPQGKPVMAVIRERYGK